MIDRIGNNGYGFLGDGVSGRAGDPDDSPSRERGISYGELADRDPSHCMSSPDGTGPHVPTPGNDPYGPADVLPIQCAECGQTGSIAMPAAAAIDW